MAKGYLGEQMAYAMKSVLTTAIAQAEMQVEAAKALRDVQTQRVAEEALADLRKYSSLVWNGEDAQYAAAMASDAEMAAAKAAEIAEVATMSSFTSSSHHRHVSV